MSLKRKSEEPLGISKKQKKRMVKESNQRRRIFLESNSEIRGDLRVALKELSAIINIVVFNTEKPSELLLKWKDAFYLAEKELDKDDFKESVLRVVGNYGSPKLMVLEYFSPEMGEEFLVRFHALFSLIRRGKIMPTCALDVDRICKQDLNFRNKIRLMFNKETRFQQSKNTLKERIDDIMLLFERVRPKMLEEDFTGSKASVLKNAAVFYSRLTEFEYIDDYNYSTLQTLIDRYDRMSYSMPMLNMMPVEELQTFNRLRMDIKEKVHNVFEHFKATSLFSK